MTIRLRSQKQPLDWSLHATPLRQQLFRWRQHATLRPAFCEQGYEAPDWNSLQRPPPGPDEREFGDFLCVLQQRATFASDKHALDLHFPHIDATSRVLLLSQAGPHAAQALAVFPTSAEVVVPPYFSESCCCSGFACRYLLRHARAPAVAASTRSGVTSGVLASRALPLERAVARVCHEAEHRRPGF